MRGFGQSDNHFIDAVALDDLGDVRGTSKTGGVGHLNSFAIGLDVSHHLVATVIVALQFLD